MAQKPEIKPENEITEVPEDLINRQIDLAIEYIAYMRETDKDKVEAEIRSIGLYKEIWDEGYMGIYAIIKFKSGEKCVLPLVYIFEGEIKEATMPHMFSDGECYY